MENFYFATLGFLIDHEKHGYELFKEITEHDSIGDIYKIKIGRLYAILKKLEENEFVTSNIKPDGSRPPRKIFQITDHGRESFAKWMQDPIRHGREIRIGFLLKLYFLRNNAYFDHNEVIDTQIAECERWLGIQMEGLENNTDKNNFEYYILQFRKSQIEGYITWLKWCKRSFHYD